MRVPILKVPFDPSDIAAVQGATAEILGTGALSLGKYTKQFEDQFAAFTGSRYAAAVSNGTSALEIILRALEIEGGSVIVPTNTFLATAYAVIHSGNRVIFADSEPQALALDVSDVERRIAPDTRAVILVHIGGIITPAVDALRELCVRRKLFLIEDCAHAHGSAIGGRRAGTLGVAGGFSFFPTKVLVTGEGGMITTDDEAVYRAALKIRNHGKDPALGNKMSIAGNNYRISEITAAIGARQMVRASEIIAARQRVADIYDALLDGGDPVRPVRLAPGVTSTWYKYVAYLPPGCSRDAIKQTMKDRYGVALTGEVYADLCHREPLWQKYNAWGRLRSRADGPADLVTDGPFPGAEQVAGTHICLPVYPGLPDEDARYVVESLHQAVSEHVGSAV